MRNLEWVLNTLTKFRLDMITLTVSIRTEYVYLFEKKRNYFEPS